MRGTCFLALRQKSSQAILRLMPAVSIATKTAACAFGLDFIPLERERYDLVIREQNMNHPGVKILLDALCRTAFRRELEGLGGYDTSVAGDRLL